MAAQHTWRSDFQPWLTESMALGGFTPASLGRASKISQQQIFKYVIGKDVPSEQNMRALARALGVQPPIVVFYADAAVAEPAATFTDAPARELLRELLGIWRRLGTEQRFELLRYAAGL